jgi:integrase
MSCLLADVSTRWARHPSAVLHWLAALCQTGLTGVHFHDLRHTGNHFTAASGATLRELMDRMGHSTSRAASIYLHGSMERQQMIADAISEQTRQQMTSHHNTASGKPGAEASGT